MRYEFRDFWILVGEIWN